MLQKRFETPSTPKTELTLQGAHGCPELRVSPDQSRKILGVEVFFSRDAAKNAPDRFWQYAPAVERGSEWVASLHLHDLSKPLWVYANVRYQLDDPITGAGYYYGI